MSSVCPLTRASSGPFGCIIKGHNGRSELGVNLFPCQIILRHNHDMYKIFSVHTYTHVFVFIAHEIPHERVHSVTTHYRIACCFHLHIKPLILSPRRSTLMGLYVMFCLSNKHTSSMILNNTIHTHIYSYYTIK